MHKLFPYFEREMTALRNNMQEATKRYPTLASMFGFSGGQCTDPSAQRVMEGTALLGAQVARKLDYYHTRLTNDLLGILGPFYLNPIPSCAVACFEPFVVSEVATIPRGTEIRTRAEPICRFRTVYDVTVPAIAISASYTTRVDAPLSLELPPDVGGAITIAIESSGSRGSLAEAATSPVRVYIDTDTATRAALYDTLFARSLCTDSHFDAIAAITGNNRAVAQWHLPALLDLLRLHAGPGCAIAERQIAGIVGLDRRETVEKLAHEYGASLVYGYEIRLTIDDTAFVHRSIYAFAHVMDYVLGYYTPRGNFTRLIVQAGDGRELVRCAQRPGAQSPA